jgi:predicted nucleotidyltransferase
MQQELESIFGRKVDLVSKRAIVRSQNWIRRREILETAKLIYAKQER